tara:strand:+ start:1935 stop:3809 length:1875 start_codon:yes stop_codon:yes gene_type:complete
MIYDKFKIERQDKVENEGEENFIALVYNFYKRGVLRDEFKKYLERTLFNIPKDVDGKPYEYKITCLTSPGIRSGRSGWEVINPKEKINFYDPTEIYDDGDNTINDFDNTIRYYSAIIFIRKQQEREGGDDMFNDCLFYALQKGFGAYFNSDVKNDFFWKYPSTLKKYLKLDREDKVDYTLLSKIEKKLKVSIHLEGDIIYNSGSEYTKRINLILENGHYKFKPLNNKNLNKIRFNSLKSNHNLELCLFKEEKQNINILRSDLEIKNITRREFYQDYSSSKKYFYYRTKDLNEDKYKQISKEIEELKKEGIEILKFGNMKKAIFYHLYHSNLKNYEIEDLTANEAKWLDKAFSGGLIYKDTTRTKFKNVKVFDVNSHYSHILRNKGLFLPLTQPRFLRILNKNKPEFFSYGIYRATISFFDEEEDKEVYNLDRMKFRVNRYNYYTHLELKRALELGYNVKLIEDNEANAMVYDDPKKRVMVKTLFRDYIDKFYKIKKNKGFELSKVFLNMMWGSLCEKNKRLTKLKKTKNSNLAINHFIDEDDEYAVEEYKDQKLFKYPYARLGIFLTAYGRCDISRRTDDFNDKLIRIHTDGFYVEDSKDLKIKCGYDMGELKEESFFKTLKWK